MSSSTDVLTSEVPTDVTKIPTVGMDLLAGHDHGLPIRSREESSVKKPKLLLDLPLDVLKEIVKKLTHTNDLTSIALAHSALHKLAIPHIYSRFDIVWPDGASAGEPRGGVDALTYGLATLNMAEDVFGEAAWQAERAQLRAAPSHPLSERQIRKRRGNYYAQYIRKFSLGNGPPDWVEEYLTNKEQGKMLGTLVALAVARMKSLESFVWDMPTGILNDVWTSLSYLGDRCDGESCRLEKVWIRWHRNELLCPHMYNPSPPQGAAGALRVVDQSGALARVEHPSFSILPPLKSLSVLDIDELQYLDEMSVLIGRSLEKLRELRVSISTFCRRDEWTLPWNGENDEQINYSNPVRSTVTIGGKRRGGVFGVLTSSFLDLKQREAQKVATQKLRRRSGATPLVQSPSRTPAAAAPPLVPVPDGGILSGSASGDGASPVDAEAPHQTSAPESDELAPQKSSHATVETEIEGAEDDNANDFTRTPRQTTPKLPPRDSGESIGRNEELPRRLHLETLELERVTLWVPAVLNALDWTKLSSLTLLDCASSDQLWTSLAESFARESQPNCMMPSPARRRSSVSYTYRLRLKTVHTNTVTPAFLNFMHSCIAPNTLESAYLQDFSGSTPEVDIDLIFTSIIKRHRASIRRLVVDSCKRKKSGQVARSSSWKKWAFSMDHLKFITSGKMPMLKELGFCLEYGRSWHYFVQRLPGLPHLRSLYIPRYSSSSDTPEPPPKELAMHLLDAVVFNPAMELCYMGIYEKCFEILEGDQDPRDRDIGGVSSSRGGLDESTDDDDDDEDEEDEDDEDDDNHHNTGTTNTTRRGSADTHIEYIDSGSEMDDSGSEPDSSRLHIREILFYDDKVPIFRVRHGKL